MEIHTDIDKEGMNGLRGLEDSEVTILIKQFLSFRREIL